MQLVSRVTESVNWLPDRLWNYSPTSPMGTGWHVPGRVALPRAEREADH